MRYGVLGDMERIAAMTVIEWCRKNAPTLWKDLPDDELLKKMKPQLETLGDITTSNVTESVEYNTVNNYLDYMVLELSRQFGNKLAFKGGYMLTKLMSSRARQTYDIDFSILSDEIYESITKALENICLHFESKGIIDSYVIKESIKPTMSGGADMYKDGRKVLGVDVGWHDITYGTVIRKLDVGDLNSFEVERMLADKITAILSRKRFRRPKDIYDLYCISECMTFDTVKIADYIQRRTSGAGADWQNFPFNDAVITEYEKAYNKLIVSSVYKDTVIEKPNFLDVIKRFDIIAEHVKDLSGNTIWDYNRLCFVNKEGRICESS